MGVLRFGREAAQEFEDRLLAHLKVVIQARLRRKESFFVGWRESVSSNTQRMRVWISPTTPLVFEFDSREVPLLNPLWLHALDEATNSSRDISVMTEQEAELVEQRTDR